MKQYLTFLEYILARGIEKKDRTGTGVLSIFGYDMRFNLEHFPLVTTKKIHMPSVVYELLWFLRGDTNISYLQANGVRIWNEWADEKGELGPIYGKQWRSWQTTDGCVIDQMQDLVDTIKSNPDSRRLLISAWNVGDLKHMHLQPCHVLFQFYIVNGRLSCKLTQRSADAFLGVPFNIASYSLLTAMVAQQCGLGVGEFIWSGGDCHIYLNHLTQVQTQLERKTYLLPKLTFNRKPSSLFNYRFEDIVLHDYQHHPFISAKVAV